MAFNPSVDHRRSIRLRSWDYRDPGPYFVTICTYRRELLFDDPALRTLIEGVWRDAVWRDGRRADEFVVMPNHVHGIVCLAETGAVGAQQPRDPTAEEVARFEALNLQTEWSVAAPLRRIGGERRVEPGSLAAVVRAFKSAAGKRINRLRETPGVPVWQRNYYDRIIRDGRELAQVRQYIRDNPRKWAEDKNNPANFVAQSGDR